MRKILFLLSALLVLISCNPPGHETTPTTIEFQPDGNGYVQFKTNDPAYLNTYWWDYFNSTLQPTMTVVTGSVTRVSGSPNNGHGLIFCVADGNNYYFAEITCDGYYLVGKKVGGIKSKIQDWTATPNIAQGLGVMNVLSITRTGPNNFSIYINTMITPVHSFSDASLTDGGYSGFYLVVGTSGDERFPDTPVDIRFKLTSPAAVP